MAVLQIQIFSDPEFFGRIQILVQEITYAFNNFNA
jgi:hypothetical protein